MLDWTLRGRLEACMLQLSWSELRLSTRFSPLVARGYLSGACLPTRIHCIAYNLPNRQSIKVALRGEEPAPQRLGEKKKPASPQGEIHF